VRILPEDDAAEAYAHLVEWCAQHYNLYDAWIQIRVFNSMRSKFVSWGHDLGDQEYCLDLNPAGAAHDKSSTDSLIIHELTHFKQYYFDELTHVNTDYCIWHGRRYYLPASGDERVSYYRFPWEIEARAAEDELGNLYHEQLKALGKQIRKRRKPR